MVPEIGQHKCAIHLCHSSRLLRFTNFKTALECLEAVSADYSKHLRLARSLVEEHFDAKIVIKRLLEGALS